MTQSREVNRSSKLKCSPENNGVLFFVANHIARQAAPDASGKQHPSSERMIGIDKIGADSEKPRDRDGSFVVYDGISGRSERNPT